MVRRTWVRWVAFVTLVLVMAMPATAQVQDDLAATVTALLPPGYTVTYTQTIDLGGDGRTEVIFKAASAPQPGFRLETVGIVVQIGQGAAWQIVMQTTPSTDLSTAADIYAYARNDRHPGFVIVNEHQCGANCNGGTGLVLRYTGGDSFPIILMSVNDRGTLSANPTSDTITLTGPVYAYANPRCCAEYAYTRAWAWQGNSSTDELMGGDFTFTAAPGKTLPAWFARDGQALVLSLDSFIARPVSGYGGDVTMIAPLLAPVVTISDAANQTCTAPRDAVAAALVQGNAASSAVWPEGNGYAVALRWDNRAAPTGAMAGGCLLDAGQGGGYILHLSRTADGFAGGALAAAPQVSSLIPADAVVIPPV